MQLIIDRCGLVRSKYGEVLDLSELGTQTIRRASHVEPDEFGRWWVDLAPVGGPRLGPFSARSEALAAEVQWIEDTLARVPVLI
ncbi:MAG: hypothetical protein ACOY3P_00350, partial [Planctomycetota bacterium]